jgi:hypothetical protein
MCDLQTVATALAEIREGVAGSPLRDCAEKGLAATDRLQRTLESGKSAEPERLEVLGLLGAGVAHELNNYLFVIRGTSEIAKMKLPDGDPMRAKFERIEEAVDRAERLTRMVLNTARPGDGGAVPIQLHPLVKECLKMTTSGLPDNVKVHQNIATDAAAVAVDPVLVFWVIRDVFAAAAVALRKEGGRLWVTLGPAGAGKKGDSPERGAEAGPGSFLTLTVAHLAGEDVHEGREPDADRGDLRRCDLSEFDGMSPDLDKVVDTIGAIVKVQTLGCSGRRLELSLPIGAPAVVR